MRLKKLEGKLPGRNYNKLKPHFDEFMAMNCKLAKIDFADGEYVNSHVAQTTLQTSAKKQRYPIKVAQRNGEVYLIRTDM